MIVIGTHIWIWWVHDNAQLSTAHKQVLETNESTDIGVSAISCWEVAKLVEYEKLQVPVLVEEWMLKALTYPGVQLIKLTPAITIASTQLPQPFHRDPADQIIVATARVLNCPLVTLDRKILEYPHVSCISSR